MWASVFVNSFRLSWMHAPSELLSLQMNIEDTVFLTDTTLCSFRFITQQRRNSQIHALLSPRERTITNTKSPQKQCYIVVYLIDDNEVRSCIPVATTRMNNCHHARQEPNEWDCSHPADCALLPRNSELKKRRLNGMLENSLTNRVVCIHEGCVMP